MTGRVMIGRVMTGRVTTAGGMAGTRRPGVSDRTEGFPAR